MLQIAIVDDSPDDRRTARDMIIGYFMLDADFEEPALSEYGSGEDFIHAFAPGKFDIVVLDIYMDTLTGMDTARRIRERDKSVCLLFLTTSEEHVYVGYTVQALGYVLKPLAAHAEQFKSGLAACMERLRPDGALLSVHAMKIAADIPFRDVLFADCQLRNACLHLSDGRALTVDESIGEVSTTLLSDCRFLECHRNTVVNMAHIRTMNDVDFELKNKARVPFAQRRKAELRKRYMDFFIGNGEDCP